MYRFKHNTVETTKNVPTITYKKIIKKNQVKIQFEAFNNTEVVCNLQVALTSLNDFVWTTKEKQESLADVTTVNTD